MKRTLLLVGSLAILALAVASSLQVPPVVATANKRLMEAESLVAKIQITPVSGTSYDAVLTYSKPSFLKLETPKGYMVSDGKTALEYTKATNTYVEKKLADGGLAAYYNGPEVYGWAGFFDKNAFAKVVQATKGKVRNLRGFVVTEIALAASASADREVSLLWDDKLGFQRGFTYRSTDNNLVALATEIALGKERLPESTFSLAPPAGATKAPDAPAAGAGWAGVSTIFAKSCMPCHSAATKRGGLDLTSYEGAMAKPGAVVAGDPASSAIIRTTKSGQMPMGRAPIPAADIATIEAWIKAGAKK